MRRLITALALCLVAVPAAPAQGATRLWATVNVCDTAASPDTVGIRASMPGNGTRQRLYMRFAAQWFDRDRDRFVSSGSRSRWIHVGSARYRSTQAGYSFKFDPPPAGEEFVFRGKVSFQWRARRKGKLVVVKRRTRITRKGIRGVEKGDPPGHSRALCVVRP